MSIENNEPAQPVSPPPKAAVDLSGSQEMPQDASPLAVLQSSLPDVSPEKVSSNFQDVEENPMLVVETGSPAHKDGTCFHVQLFGSGCLDCVSLVDGAEVAYKKCHFMQGNLHCPAAYFRIEFIGDRVKWESKVKRIKDLPDGVDKTNRKLALLDEARNIEEGDLRQRILTMLGL